MPTGDPARAEGGSDAARAALEALERAAAARGAFDFDRLVAAGIRAAAAGDEVVDASVLAWLEAAPDVARLDAAAALLTGLWHGAHRRRPVEVDRIDRLLAARAGVALDDTAAYSMVLALCEAARADAAPEVRARLTSALDDLERRDFAGPVRALARDVIARARARLCAREDAT